MKKVKKEEVKAAPEEADQPSEDQVNKDIITMDDNAVKYDVAEIRQFLATVFHVELNDDQHIWSQISKSAPSGFGTTPDMAIRDTLAKTQAPMRGYFSTSTLSKTEGMMRHTKMAFKQFHVLVLDDVGTKIPEDKIPETLAENYAIESSEGNFQFGYILKEPITDYQEAQCLIDLFVDAGLTDGGGAMPVKKVRLPCGVNGKSTPAGKFHVKLRSMNTDYWDIQELLDAAGINVDWEVYRKTAAQPAKRAKRIGATAWNPDNFYHDPLTGIYDPVLEFMYQQGQVVQDCQLPFFDVICPFHTEHTEPDLKAQICGYSPLGHGLHPTGRKFNCFHDSCKARTNEDFLEQIWVLGGPHMPAREFAPAEVANMVYDSVNDKVYDLKEKGAMVGRNIVAAGRTKQKVRVGDKYVEQIPLWLRQPSAIEVRGPTFDPSTRDRMVRDNDGALRVNLFDMPDYPSFKPDPGVVKIFTDFIDYLLPDNLERGYFMQWLACKVQNPAFRGAAIILITQAQGTGKNTLMNMISAMFGRRNTQQMNIDALVDPRGEFNEWASKLFVNVNETLAVTEAAKSRKAYNKLKEIVDPMAMDVMVNEKYGVKYLAKCATSFLFFSNHIDAVYTQDGDRRFFAAYGPDVPAGPEYFEMIHGWIRKSGWEGHIWNYLLEMEVSEKEMMAAPPMTETMKEVKFETTTPLTAVVEGAIATWPSAIVPHKIIKELMVNYVPRGVPEDHMFHVNGLLRDKLVSFRSTGVGDKVRGMRCGLRRSAKTRTKVYIIEQKGLTLDAIQAHRENTHMIQARVDAWLEEQGYDF